MPESVRHVAASLLKLHFKRSVDERVDAQRMQDYAALLEDLTVLLNASPSLQDFVHFLLAVAFMARPEESM
ncbi:MAG: hypothetical protein NZ742_09605 [Acidobacteria bacterium]|nr:hypothetical protein [Acidobacteriota bacterium]MDW7985028.1 hypothetical protein [Acidobacteriota bacterium]